MRLVGMPMLRSLDPVQDLFLFQIRQAFLIRRDLGAHNSGPLILDLGIEALRVESRSDRRGNPVE